ncbi:MAG: sigma-54 dependent transcriptional regulator [Desulfobacterales bacterium]|nr:sigma-54 dependent transcriptional regulator [Desulfobacterales bacterium]
MMAGNILAIDDEQNIRHLIQSEFELEGLAVTTAGSGEEGLNLFDSGRFDVVLLDINLPKLNGVEVLKRLKQKAPQTEVIMITGYGDVKSAVESIKQGARDYITKPFKLNEILALVKQAIRDNNYLTVPQPEALEADSDASYEFIKCPSHAMQPVYELAKKVAATDITVLLQGETGTGKDVMAKQIHYQSKRRNGPFTTLDCGLLNQNLAESELYGHRKGAFSGATERKLGLVEKSHQGTLFLDEIGNIDLDLQKKFLRFLETRKFRRVGETQESEVDTRIILATNMDLQEALKKGNLRQDLFYRMDVIQIYIPPLRDRPEDIERLARYFLQQNALEIGPKRISDEAIRILSDYLWPGNLRELKSVINKASILAESDMILPEDLPSHLAIHKEVRRRWSRTLQDMEKEHIINVLEKTGGNQSKASEILGINRKTLYKKIHKYKIFS